MFTSVDDVTARLEFAQRYGGAAGPRTTVLVLGDARTNMTDPNLAAVRDLVRRARRVYWLNPEARAHWGTGDWPRPPMPSWWRCTSAARPGSSAR